MKKAIIPLALILALSLCACSVTELLGGLFGKKTGAADAGKDSAATVADYAQRLAKAGNERAAAAVLEKLPNAAKAEAQEKAIDLVQGDPRADMVHALVKMGAKDAVKAASSGGFADVKESDWFSAAVKWAAEREIVSGEKFSPNDPCTRAQAITFLWRAKGKPAHTLKVSPFTDVPEDSYFFEPVLWAYETGLLTVSNDGAFRPDDPVTRAQTVTFLFRAEGAEKPAFSSPFADVKDDDWFAPQAIWAWAQEIVTLNDARTFQPNGACNRAQYVFFLYRCYGN